MEEYWEVRLDAGRKWIKTVCCCNETILENRWLDGRKPFDWQEHINMCSSLDLSTICDCTFNLYFHTAIVNRARKTKMFRNI